MLTLSATGSNLSWTGPLSYSATGSPVTRSITSTSQGGTYSVTQTVANCTSPPATVNVVVNQTPSITSTSSSNPTTCLGSDGTITLGGLVSGFTYSVTYDKNAVGQGPVNVVANGSGQVVITGLTAGSYTNFIISINGCPSAPVAGPIVLTDPSNPSSPTNVIASPNPICINNTLTLSATGSSLSWTGPSSYSATGSPVTRLITTTLFGGTYSVTQTVANCTSAPATVTVVVKPTPGITSTSFTNPTTCGGTNGSITLNGLFADSTYSVTYDKNSVAQGPFTIAANGSGQVVISGLTAGTYSNFVVTLSGCPSNPVIGSITLTDPSNPPAPTNVTASPNPICSGNTLTLSATGSNLAWTGPLSYSGSGSPVTISITAVTQGGIYSVTQTVANCVSPPATVTVVVNPTPIITSTSGANPTTCGGTEGTITLSGLNTSTSYTVNYNKNASPVGPVLISTNVSGQLVITGLTAGTYSNIVVTLTGCPSAAAGPITLTDPANPAAPVATNSGPSCYGDTLKLFASNVLNGTYVWTGPGGYTSTEQNPIRVNATPAMSGVYSVVVTVANCNSTPATTSVTVASCPPVAVNDNYSTNEDQSLTVSAPGVLTNDYDPANPQQPITANTTPVSNPVHGTVTLNADGSFTYTPSANFNGLDSFIYSICDNEAPPACDTATVYITVVPVNDPPVVPDTTVTTPEDTAITVCIPITDPESGTQSHLIQSIYCGPSNGTIGSATINNGLLPHTLCVTYNPNLNFNGTDSICLVICDNGTPQLCDTTKVTIIVTPVNDPPIAVEDYYVSCLDTAIVKNVMTNDSDVDGPALAVTGALWGPSIGTLSLFANGSFTYTPTPFFNSLDSFSYRICDNGTPNLCDTAVVILDYTCTNTPPVAVNDNYTIPEDDTLIGNVSTNDYDPNGDSLIYNTTPVAGVSHGSLTLNNDGTFTYVPTPNYFGPDSFVYSVCDNGVPPLCDTATAYITVIPVNDPPYIPDTTVTTPEDTPTTVCIEITDIDVTNTHVSIVGCNPANGSLSSLSVNNLSNPHLVCVTYSPNTNFNGTDSFCIVVCDNGVPSACDTSVVTIIVTPVNDPPVANNDNYSTNEDTQLNVGAPGVQSNDSDPDGTTLTSTLVSGTSNGSVTLNPNGSFTYTPNTNFTGTDTFVYSVCDAGIPLPPLCDTAIVVITVNPVNDPPFIPDTTVTTPEDTPTTVCIPITDPETTTQIHLAFLCDNPNSGSITAPSVNLASNPHTVCVTYTPNTNFNGTDSFCVIVCDNGNPILCDTSIVTIVVTPVNDPPVANNDNYSTGEDTPLNVGAPGVQSNDSDPDGTTLTSTIVTGTSNGSVTLNPNGSFTYTPDANFNGTDTFVYSICDAGIPLPPLCDTAIVVITVNPQNDPPYVPDTTVTTPEDTAITVCLPISDGDVGQQYIATICGTPANGLITFGPVVNNGSIPPTVCVTYTPNTNFNGIDSLCITVCDNGIPFLCDNSIVKINVTPVNDPPVANNDSYTTPEDTPLNVTPSGVLGNDNDPDGTALTSTLIDSTSNGSLVLNGNGSFTYVPNSNYNGTDTFYYSACDAGIPLPSLCDTAMVVITVTPGNDPPEIPDTTVTTCEDCPITVCLPITDTDSLDVHSYTSLCPGQNGTVTGTTINQSTNTLCFTYTPYLNVNGSDTVCFIVCDNGTPQGCDTTTITILITPVNDPPYADTIYVVTFENQPVGVNVASATGDPEGNPLSYSYYGVIPGGGTYGITGNGAIVVYPNPGFTGTFAIPYSVCDLSPYPVNILCDSAAIIVTVLPEGDTLINHSPVASNDYVTTSLNTPVVVNELANDYDPDGDALQVTVTCTPDDGNYTVNPNGTINYFPDNGFFGFDTICYTICDPTAVNNPKPLCDNAIVVIYVSTDSTSFENDPPVAVDDFAYICADANATLNLLLNDNDPNGDAITSVSIIDNVDYGVLSNAGFGFYVYTPNGSAALNDTLLYEICDNGTPSLCDTGMAVIFINATPVVTPSVGSAIVCSNDNVNITFTSSVPGTVISWTATNGTSGTGNINTVLTNNTSVDQVVTYTVSGTTGFGCGSSALIIPVTVKPRPVITFTSNGSIFCSGEQVVINANSNIAGTTYTWSGTNGSSGTGSLISDNPVNSGTANITVTYTIIPTYNGCVGNTLAVDVTVKPQPSLTVNPATQTICSGAPISIAITPSISGTSVNWFGSNGNSGNSLTINDSPFNFGSSNITVTYTVNGNYNGCPANTVFATVVVRPRVVADAGQDKTVVACTGSCVIIGSSPTGAGGSGTLAYAWSPSAGLNDSTLANPTACGLLVNTTYTVIVSDGSGCSATDQVTITSTPNPLSAEAGAGGALCLGSGDSVMLGGFPTAVGGVAPYTYTWSPLTGLNLTNNANPDAFPTTTTEYFVTVTDQIGCQSVDSTVVTVYPVLVANAGADTTVCATFAAQLGGTPTASGGSGTGYTYIWSPTVGISNVNDANPTATPAVLTTYSVYVADGNGCTATDNVIVTVHSNPTAHAGPDKTIVTCSGDSTTIGDVPAVTGGTGPYTYSWTPAIGLSNDTIANPVVKGITVTTTYMLSITDANGCVSTDNVTVNVVTNTLQAQAGPDEAVCSNNNCVQVGGIPTAVGGTPPYVYDWSNGTSLSDSTASNPLACPSSTTTYTVVVTDSKGCTATDAETVTVNPSPSANAGPDTSVCSGSSIAIGGAPTATGGTPGYAYSWNPTVGLSLPNVANPSASPVVVTTYQLIVTDAKGCAALDEVTVTPRPNPVVDAGADKTLVSCVADTAFMLVNVTGGTSPYSFVWSPATGLSSSTVQNPYATGLTVTTSYQVAATDTFGCSATDFIVVNVVQSTLQADAGNDGQLCGNSGSSVSLGGIPTAVGGTSPYTYNWGTSTSSVSNLPNPTVSPTVTTTYYVTVTDSKGCTSVDSVTVVFNPAPSADAGTDTTMCSGFCVTIGGTPATVGGTGPYQFLWSPTVGLNSNNNPNPLACPLVTTTYNLLVTDANGCQSSDAVTITILSNPTANAGPDQTLVNCSSDSITIGGSPAASGGAGGYAYSWSPSGGLSADSIANPFVKGINVSQLYTLVVTDLYGCSAEDAVVVNVVPGNLTAEAGSGGSYCQGIGGSVTLGGVPTAVGGTPSYSYSWSGGLSPVANPVASPASTTTYYVTVSDSKGCIAVDSVTVTVNPAPMANAGADTTLCGGLSVMLGGEPTASGGTPGYTYVWAPSTGLSNSAASNPTATPNATTTYTVRVTDANGCSASDAVQVTILALPVADAGADQTLVACSADSVQIGGSPSASGGTTPYTYDWSPNGGLSDTSASNPYVSLLGSSTTFTLVVTSNNGCSASDQVTVNVNNSTLVAEAGNDVAFCEGASVSITLGGSPTAVGGTAPFSYSWSPATGLSSTSAANPVATPLVTTTYSVIVTDATGCVAGDTVRITINPRPVVSAGLADTVCAGSAIQIGGTPTASGGTGSYSYSWNLGLPAVANPIINPIATLTYVVTVTDSLGCSNNGSVTIKVNQNPTADAGADQTVVACPDACVTLGGSPTSTGGGGGYLYAWAPSAGLNNTGLSNPSACNLSQSLTYNLTVTDANGCTAIDQVSVTVNQSTLAADAGNDKSICAGQPICITIGGTNAVSGGTSPYVIDWSPVAGICNSNVIPNPDVNPTDTTTYVLLVTDALGCIAVDSMVVYANPAVTASVSPDTAICQGGSALLGSSPTGSGGTSPFTYSWNPGSGLNNTTSANPIASPSATTSYCVTVTDAVGCSSSTCQTVTVNAGVTADAGQDRTITECPGAFTILGGSPTGSGGSNNYSYAWSPTANLNGSTIPNPIATGLTVTTTFTVTVTDNATGCFSTDQVVVTVLKTNLGVDAGSNKVFCANSTGCVVIGGNPTAIGGQPPYIYQWAPVTGMNDPTIANPCVAPINTTQYLVTVTDQLGCFEVDSMTVIVSPLIAVNAGNDTSICTATSVILGGNPPAVGGTTPYTYAWSLGAFPSSSAHPTATPVSNSSYTLVVTDSLGCSSSDIVNVALRPLPTASAGPDATITACTADSAVIGGAPTASGTTPPYTYEWNPPVALNNANASNPVVQNLGFTTLYTVTVVDTFGCSATDQTQVTVLPNTLFAEAGVNIGSLCANVGGCVTLGGNPTVTGGVPAYSYNWLGGVNDPTSPNPSACPVVTTTYTVIVTDQDGCESSDTIQVIVNDPPNASVVGLNSSYCINDPNVVMTGSPSGGIFSGPGVTGNVFQPASVGEGYWCIQYSYMDPLTGCADDTTICVTVNPLPAVTASGFAPAYCRFDAPVTLVGSPAGGIFTGSSGLSGVDGSTFEPSTATVGNNVITYTYTDLQSGCSNTYIFVINVKDAPAISISASIDTSCQGASVTFTPAFSFDVFNIVWSLDGGGNIGAGLNPFTYTPETTDYCVIATAINTPNGCVSTDTICGHVNQPPVANDDFAETCEEIPVPIQVILNDTDPEGDNSDVTVITTGHGSSTVSGNVLTYTSNVDYFGSDTITYQVCNTACVNACDTGTVIVSVCPVNDPPVITDVVDTIYINTSDTVCPPIEDVDDAINTLTVTTFDCDTINGTISVLNGCIVYVPTTDWTGTQVICVSVCDTSGTCDTGTVTIVVIPANNPPIAQKVSVVTCERTTVGVNVASATTDPDGNLMTYSYGAVTGPGTGIWVVTGNGSGVFVANTPGVYHIPYSVCDISNIPVSPLCDTNEIVVTVIECDSSNTPPVATDDEVITTVNTPIVVNELANDYDADGDPLNVAIICGPGLGQAQVSLNPDNTISYSSPVAGIDTICYTICDPSGACDTAIIVIHVNTTVDANHPPVAVDDFETTTYQTPVDINVQGNDHDPDGNPITTTSIPGPPTGGTATINPDGTINYVPTTANAYDPDTFTYVICDNGNPALCDTATVVVYIINSVVAVDECTETGYNHPVVINVLSNDYDPDIIDSIWVSSSFNLQNTQGTTFVDSKGMIHYIPNSDSCGYIDTFAYIIQDEGGAVDTGYVCVVITCCKAPIAVMDTAQVISGDSVSVNVTLNDTIDGPTPVHVVVIGPSHGTAYFVDSVNVMYVPDAGYCGYDTFTYAGENLCGFDTGFVVVNVICNTKPIAFNDTFNLCRFDTLTLFPELNDVDADGNTLTISGIGTPSSSGLLTVLALTDSSVTVISTGVLGDVTVDYYICDNGLPVKCDTGTIVIHIDPCDKPVVKDIYDTIQSCAHNDSICLDEYVTLSDTYTWSITGMCAPQNGTVTNLATCFTYTPNQNFFGNDTFCVIVCSNIEICDTALVIMTSVDCNIQAVDESCDLDTTIINTPITVDILANDIIPWAGDTTVTLLTLPANGSAVVNNDNTVTYTPNTDYKGSDEFSYLVCAVTGDYVYCDTATVCITVIDTIQPCYIPNAFSPNGDGANDLYKIPCDKNPRATLRVFNRWGVEVWYSEGAYANDWGGTNMQGTPLPDGTYYIIYEYNDGTGKREAKFVVIQR